MLSLNESVKVSLCTVQDSRKLDPFGNNLIKKVISVYIDLL